MKIIVFGASGGTGSQIVKQALEAGNEVTAIVRNPSAFTVHHRDLFTIKSELCYLNLLLRL